MTYVNKVQKQRNTVIKVTIVVIILTLAISLILPQQYRSQTKLLIIQKQSLSLDAYLASKSAEKIGKLLSEVVYSSSFFDKVWQAGFNIGTDWGANEKQRRQLWENRIELKSIPQTSLLEINTYHQDRAQAEQLAQAVIYVLVEQGAQYHGGGDQVEIKMVDKPITSTYPVRPNLVVNTVWGLLLGLLIGLFYIYLKSEKNIDIEAQSVELAGDVQIESKIEHTGYLRPKE